ncbi:MAG: hypothetical protein P8013_02955 [Candidatus Sulfobium sp.]|jgi:hypothetical protein
MKKRSIVAVLAAVLLVFALSSISIGGGAEISYLNQIWSKVSSYLDASVSSRAPSSTALSTSTWTSARASKVDNLDAAVSSRAPSSTALSTSVWTSARAGKLDNLDAAISSISPIASIQRGTLTTINGQTTVNISSVTTSKSLLLFNYIYNASCSYGCGMSGKITSSTTLTFYPVAGADHYQIDWQVIEFK